MRRASILAVALLAAAPAASAQNTSVIRGRVMADDGGLPKPISNARVSTTPAAGRPLFTDADGRFEFKEVRPGRYTLTAEKSGFVATRFGARNDLDAPVPIVVVAGETVEGIEIRIAPGAAISGRIVDDLGEPVVGASVTAGVLQKIGDEVHVAAGRTGQTDDRGEYRVGGLAAGRYYISVNGASEGAAIRGAPPEWRRTTGWMRTIYPSASTIAGATPIMVTAGQERTGIDFALAPTRGARLALSLRDATGAPVAGLINLFQTDDTHGVITENRGVPFSADTPTMTPTVPPGDWVAVSLADKGKAVAHVTLASGEESALTLTIGAGARITGRVIFEGSSAHPALATIRLAVRGAGVDASAPPQALSNGPVSVSADGTFEISGTVGTIELQPVSPIPGWKLRAIALGNRDLLDEPLTLRGNEAVENVQVIFSDRLGEVAGTSIDTSGAAAPACQVGLFAESGGPRGRSRRFQLQRADLRGRFRFSDLLPGTYLVIATNLEAGTWMASENLDRMRQVAERVTLPAGEAKTIALQCRELP